MASPTFVLLMTLHIRMLMPLWLPESLSRLRFHKSPSCRASLRNSKDLSGSTSSMDLFLLWLLLPLLLTVLFSVVVLFRIMFRILTECLDI